MPIVGVSKDFAKCPIIPFDKSIGLGVVGDGPVLLDIKVDAELLDQLVLKMGTLIHKNFLGNTMLGDNFVHKKGEDGLGSGSLYGLGFGPLGKVLCADKDI